MELRGLVYLLGAGDVVQGLAALLILAAGAEVSRRMQAGEWLKMVLCVAPAYLGLIGLRFAQFNEPQADSPMILAAVAAGTGLLLSLLNEARTRRLLARVSRSDDAEELLRVHGRAYDARLRRAALMRMADVPVPETVDYLLHLEADSGRAEDALQRIAEQRPDLLAQVAPRNAVARERRDELLPEPPEQGLSFPQD
jgi:hypothetical protein